jgi:hypothetical protein
MGDRTKQILALILGIILISVAQGAIESSKIVYASDVTEKIKAGQPVDFDNCTIVGDLNLGEIKIEKPVQFKHTLFQNSVNFNSATFNGTAYFWDSTFNSYAYFIGSRFNRDASFWGSSFNGDTIFMSSRFNGDASFEDSTFNGVAEFWGTRFNGYAYFFGSTFNRTADFWGTSFNDGAAFAKSSFNGDAIFERSNFNGLSNFWLSSFNDNADFEYSRFNADATFGKSSFNGDADFECSRFNGNVSFLDSRFNKDASYIDSQFGGYTSFNNAQFSKGVLRIGEDAVFYGTLDLNRSNINSIDTYIRWNNIKNLRYNIKAYNLLFNNYKKWGLFEDYNNCYYTFRKELLFHETMGFTKLLDYFQWILNGFGMKPIFPIMWSTGIILISGAIFYIINGIQRLDAKNTPNIVYVRGYIIPRKPLKERVKSIIFQKRTISIGEAMLFSATYFSSGANNIISSQPTDLSPVGVSRYIAVLERLMGWFFFALFLSALGNTAIR